MTTACLLEHALQIRFQQSRLYHIWNLQAAEKGNNFSDNGENQGPFLKSPVFLKVLHIFLRKSIKKKSYKTTTTPNEHTSRKTQTSKMLVGTPWSINPKEISALKKLGCFFSIGKSSVMRKVNFAVGNEATCRHCYILTGKFMFTLHQEPIEEKQQNQDTPLLKSKTIHGCKKTKINVSCLAQEETFELLSEKGDPTFNLWFVQ